MAAPYLISVGTVASGTGNITPGVPSGYAADDIFIMYVISANESVSAPAGWAAAGTPQGLGTPGAAGATMISAFWKRATGSESAPTVTDSGNFTGARIACFRGCVTTGNPIEASNGDAEVSSTAACVFPSVTTTTPDCAIVWCVACDAQSSAPSGITDLGSVALEREAIDNNTFSAGTGGSFGAYCAAMGPAGAVGTEDLTLGVASAHARLTLALKPPAGGGTTPKVVATAEVASTASTSIGIPTGYAANDILLLFIATANEAIATPTGFTECTDSPQGTGTTADAAATRLAAFWKRASASESSVTIADAGDHFAAIMLALRYAKQTGDPFEDTAGDVEAGSSTSITWPAVTTTGAERRIIFAASNATDTLTGQYSALANGNLTSVRLRESIQTTNGNGGGIGVGTGDKQAAGSTGSATGTLANASAQGRITLALMPDDGAGAGAWVPRVMFF